MQIVLPGVHGNGEIYMDILKSICGEMDGMSMVDLGCHRSPYISQLPFSYKEYVDIQDRPLDDPSQQPWFINQDVFDFLTKKIWTFSVSIASDFIEHLSKDKGYELLRLMEAKSYKQVIFTPLGEYDIGVDESPDVHKSGWLPEDFQNYATIVLPDFHPSLNIGAFFAWHTDSIKEDFERVLNELKQKSWIKLP